MQERFSARRERRCNPTRVFPFPYSFFFFILPTVERRLSFSWAVAILYVFMPAQKKWERRSVNKLEEKSSSKKRFSFLHLPCYESLSRCLQIIVFFFSLFLQRSPFTSSHIRVYSLKTAENVHVLYINYACAGFVACGDGSSFLSPPTFHSFFRPSSRFLCSGGGRG